MDGRASGVRQIAALIARLRGCAVQPALEGAVQSLMVNRRRLLIGGLVGGGLLVGWEVLPRHYPSPLLTGPGEFGFADWLTIDGQGVVTVAVPQLEMGQGITTLIPQIIAAELGADWRQVAVQAAPISEIYANLPLAARWSGLSGNMGGDDPASWLTRRWAQRHRFMATADGTSIAAYEGPARIAAATARSLLAMAAAARWGLHWQDCDVSGGMVRHGEKALGFGALAGEASRLTPPDPPQLLSRPLAEPPSALGAPAAGAAAEVAFPRLDIPSKLDGSFAFAGDIRLPDMVFAAIRHAPVGRAAELSGVDEARAKGVLGYRQLVKGPDWLAAVGDNWWAAEQALGLIAPRFMVHHPAETLSVEGALDKALKTGAATAMVVQGDAAAMLGTHPPLTQRYDVAPAFHAGLETATATARWRKSGWFTHVLDLWVATQAPEQTRRAVADALGIAVESVVLYPVAAGGSFDARLETPHAVEAALIARKVARPVQLIYSRWQEQLAGVMRPPVAAQLSAQVDPSGRIVAWATRLAAPAAAREFGQRLFHGASRGEAMAGAGDHADPLVVEGAEPPYGIAQLKVEHVPVAVGLPSGRLRGNAHGYTAFFTESFIDEIATGLKREPLSFRMTMLEGDPRLAACLQRVSSLAGWNGGADRSGNGLACHRIGGIADGGCIAAIATARRVAAGAGGAAGPSVLVDRIFVVADIGRILNADIARQQIEGGLIYGIGLALGSSSPYVAGLPTNTRLSQLDLPVLGNCPEIQVEFVSSDADPFDPGELGVAVAAPAIANALASATGLRFRKLPLIAEEE